MLSYFFSNLEKKLLLINRFKEFGWEDKTITNSMIPDTQDRFFRKVNGLAVCLILGRGDGDDLWGNKNELGVKIDMVGCPSENPTTAELFSGWQIYIPNYIPLRFILKNRVYAFDGVSFEGRLLSENFKNILDEDGQLHYQFIEFEESK